MIDWDQYCPHDSRVIVIGDIESGKTVCACSILDHYHRKKIKCAIVAEKSVAQIYQETAPWIKHIDPSKTNHPNDTAILLDDAFIYAYARSPWKDVNQNLDFMLRESRHTGNSYIYTTQQSTVLDINLVRMMSCVIIKEPSIFQTEPTGERSIMRKRMQEASKAFEKEKLSHKEAQKCAYIISRKRRTPLMINGITPPKWFNTKISKSYRYAKLQKREKISLKKLFKF